MRAGIKLSKLFKIFLIKISSKSVKYTLITFLMQLPIHTKESATKWIRECFVSNVLRKLEGIYRSGQGPDDFFSGAFGFEYTFSDVFGTPADVGVIAEYIKDERDEKATTPLQDDVAIGVRLAFNDAASSEALIGVVQDTETSARLITVEASRRVGSSWKATLEVCVFSNVSPQDALYDLRNDDYLRFELAYYF